MAITLAIPAFLAGCAAPEAGERTINASFYGCCRGEKLSRHTANGEVFNPNGLTAAHRTMPFNTMVKVTYGAYTVTVRVNDRGPAKWTGREIDLSYGAAKALGFTGVGKVKIKEIGEK